MDRKSHTFAVTWFLDIRRMERIDLEPTFQRHSVWNLEYRQFFIDTIIRNFPCPTIFLVKEYPEKKLEPTYAVVDGKQRLTSIFKFCDGEFCTAKYDNEPELSEKYFPDLPENVKRLFLDYILTVEIINNAIPAELNEAFDRMNRNVLKLNAQELRHARYSGRFINFCETWAENPWFQNSSVATQKRVDRMYDVEFISELIVLTERGIQNGKEILDEIYSDYDTEIPEEAKLYSNFEAILEVIKALGLSNNTRDPFGKIVDIYSLWAAIREIHLANKEINIQESKKNLLKLAEEIGLQSTEAGVTYYINAQRQTNSFNSRLHRSKVIENLIVTI